MSPDVSERSFEDAVECGLLQYGPDACRDGPTGFREMPLPYGVTSPGGYRKRGSQHSWHSFRQKKAANEKAERNVRVFRYRFWRDIRGAANGSRDVTAVQQSSAVEIPG